MSIAYFSYFVTLPIDKQAENKLPCLSFKLVCDAFNRLKHSKTGSTAKAALPENVILTDT